MLPLPTQPAPAGAPDALLNFVKRPQQFLLELAKAEGPVATFTMSGYPYALLSDPEDVQRVLAVEGAGFAKGAMADIPRAFGGDGLFTAEGEDWAAQRSAVHGFFSRTRIQALGPLIAANVARLLDRWTERGDGLVDVMAETKRLAFDVVSRALLGIPPGPLADDLIEGLTEVDRADHVTVWLFAERFRRAVGSDTRAFGASSLTGAMEQVDRAAYALVDERMRRRPEPGTEPADVLDAMLASPELAAGGLDRLRSLLRDQIVTLLLAGYVTTGESMFWSSYLLARNPEAQVAARAETAPTRPFLAAVAREALRLYPPAWFIGRVAQVPVRLGSRELAAGTRIITSPYVLHRLPALWPDPDEFRPERFAGLTTPVRGSYIPFGSGVHACLGRPLALAEVSEFLAGLVERFDVALDDDTPPELTGSFTLRPRQRVLLRVRRRF
jgi:cytochrome P450